MKLVTYRGEAGRIATGVVTDARRVLDVSGFVRALPVDDAVCASLLARGVETAPEGMLRLLQAGDAGMRALRAYSEDLQRSVSKDAPDLAEVDLLAPVPRPGKIVAVGRNYASHAAETQFTPNEKPRIIAKLSSSVSAPDAIVALPARVEKADFEAELGVVIGRHAEDVSAAHALDHVAGYTVLNDLSAREFQFDVSPPQTTFAKSMRGFCPMGPWLVSADEVPDPQSLDVRAWLNDDLMQTGNTADMLFPVASLIEWLSHYLTLEPGDVIATGTPSGSGGFRTPPRYLRSGDRLRFEVERVGVLKHAIA